MAEVKITELPTSVVPNDSSVVPSVISGTTRQLRLDNIAEYIQAKLDLPDNIVTLVQASEPLFTAPTGGILEQGLIGIRPSSSDTPGTMSIEHYLKVQQASFSCFAERLVLRDSQGSFEANNITLRAVGAGDTSSGTMFGNLTQRKTSDTGVNAKLGETTRYSAKVTSFDAEGDANFGSKVSVKFGPLNVGEGTSQIQLKSDGGISIPGNATIQGNLLVEGSGKEIRGSINATGEAFPGRFSNLVVTPSGSGATGALTVAGSSTFNSEVTMSQGLSFSSGKTITIPSGSIAFTSNGTISGASSISGTTFNGNTFQGSPGVTASFIGNLNGSSQRLATGRLINLGGVLTTTANTAFTGDSDITIQAGFVSGQISNTHIAANAQIADTKLAPITTAGKVSNAATSATSSNVGNTIIMRDSNGNFSAGTINANITGSAASCNSFSASATGGDNNWSGVNKYVNSGGSVLGGYNFPLQPYADGRAAGMSFKINSNYGINFGLDTDQIVRLGGWDSGLRWSSDTNGNFVANGNVTAYSDESLKTNWKELPHDLIRKIAKVKVGVFDRTDNGLTQVGVSAQSLREVLPEAVLEDSSNKLSVAYGNAALAVCVALAKQVILLQGEVEALKKA
jgi:hypothetical protein